jgi:hypothetical protein
MRRCGSEKAALSCVNVFDFFKNMHVHKNKDQVIKIIQNCFIISSAHIFFPLAQTAKIDNSVISYFTRRKMFMATIISLSN